MKCEEAQEWIQREMDGDLSPGEQDWLRRHLAVCPGCAAEAERLQRLSAALSKLPRVQPPHSVVDRLIESGRLPETGPSRPVLHRERDKTRARPARRFWWFGGGAAAALMIGMFGALAGWFHSGQEQAVHRGAATMSSRMGDESASSPEKAPMDSQAVDTVHSPGSPVWSPDGRFRAAVEGDRVVIRTAEGAVWYRSDPREGGPPAVVRWLSPETLRVEVRRRDKGGKKTEVQIIEVDVKGKRVRVRGAR